MTPEELSGTVPVYHQYTIRIKDRDGIQEALSTRGVQSMVYYPVPLHLQKVHDYLGHNTGDFPISERAAREVLSLPIFPEITLEQQQQVAEALRQAVEDGIPV
jgi:dTDP-4-amino-4,6-dideoxygalactose transaminase